MLARSAKRRVADLTRQAGPDRVADRAAVASRTGNDGYDGYGFMAVFIMAGSAGRTMETICVWPICVGQ